MRARRVKWERGFPVAGRLNLMGRWEQECRKNPEGSPHPLARVPALATLRALKLNSPNLVLDPASVKQLIELPALRHLRDVDGVHRHLIAEMARATLPYAPKRR